MYVLPPPRREDDPYFALRLGTISAGGFLAMVWLEPTVHSIYAILPMSLASLQRKAVKPISIIITSLMVIAMVFVFSRVMDTTRNVPEVMMTFVFFVFFVALYILARSGHPIGRIMLFVTGALSLFALEQSSLLKKMHDDMIEAITVGAILLIVFYVLIPPRTKEPFERKLPSSTGNDVISALNRAVVMMPLCWWCYSILTYRDVYLIIAAIYTLSFPSAGAALQEAMERMISVIFGATTAMVIVFLSVFVNGSALFIALLILATGWFYSEKMMTGRLTNTTYQNCIVVALSISINTLFSGDPSYVVIQRVGLTIIGLLLASFGVAILDTLFIRQDQTQTDLRHPALRLRHQRKKMAK